jgi:hypothetical protein
MGGHAERVEEPDLIGPAFGRAIRVVREQGQPALLEFVTRRETGGSSPRNDCRPV